MKINGLEFNQRCEFGTFQNTDYDVNGQMKQEFVPEFKVWFGYRQQTISQQYELEGLGESEIKIIAIRHNSEIKHGLYCKIKDDLFMVATNSSDERVGNGLNSYDVITLRRVEKRGETYAK
ncbi:prophage protein [Weissella oryzae SG25]|uniref:Prophage protein n=1 Tax=Weissella oryzae (strain DSM 25784 / JCM 18191 / LMG 30913 / SG25) TaxID=1329250 RepID=A0A069CXJ8_WEIOS|nr:phage head closure protein [Weissella oryzae]GAK31968.1 prophage protein [Weissella oryzae SG25]